MRIVSQDELKGAEELERRFLQRMRTMTLEQIEDAGGLLSILHKEVMGMNYEFNDCLIDMFDKMSKR